MDFIMVPLIMGIITLGIYKLFELFACRRERMAIIEKLGDKISAADWKGKFSLPIYNHYSFRYRIGVIDWLFYLCICHTRLSCYQ